MNNNIPWQILKIINNLRNYYTIKETIKLDEKYLKESPLNGVSYDGVKLHMLFRYDDTFWWGRRLELMIII